MLEDTDPRLAPREPPGLFLPTVHKPQGRLLIGFSPNFGDSVPLDVPTTLLGKPIQQPAAQGEESEEQGGVIGR